MTYETWLTFFVAAWLICLSPGPGAISSMSAGIRFGLRRGLWNLLGLQLGVVVVIAVVATGLGALLTASAVAFTAVKWLGVAYLVWLGIQQWRAEPRPLVAEPDGSRAAPAPTIVARGFLVNVTNAKGIVFMVAVLPQFIDATRSPWLQYLVCGVTFVAIDTIVMIGYTGLAARLLAALSEPHHIRWLNRLFGGLFVIAGALLAAFRRGQA